MKKILAAIVCLTLMLTCVTGVAEWKFERDIEVLIPASAGGGLDTTMRVFATYLEKELGVNVIIDNRAGGSHVVGMTYAYTQPRDGYTFQFMGPSTISSAAQGLFSVPMWDEMLPVCGLIQPEGVLFANPNAPFKTYEEMIEYAKANPGAVSVSVDSVNGITGALLKLLEEGAGVQFKWVAGDESEVTIATIAGDTNLLLGTWSDAGAYAESGDLVPIVTLSEQKLNLSMDVPYTGEFGVPISLGYFRAFTCFKDTPQEAIDAFAAAVKKVATENADWIAWLDQNGMSNDYLWTAEEMRAVCDTCYETMLEINQK